MPRTPSTMVPLGTPAPTFALPDVRNGRTVSLADFAGTPVLLVMFICNHCPFVKHVRSELARLGRDYRAKGVGIVAICANDSAGYPEDSPDRMKAEAADAGYTFPYLFDGTQDIARSFQAACTPDFFVYDRQRRLAYRGQLDESRPGSDIPVTGSDLRAAIDALLAGAPVSDRQKPSIGCNIKWKP